MLYYFNPFAKTNPKSVENENLIQKNKSPYILKNIFTLVDEKT